MIHMVVCRRKETVGIFLPSLPSLPQIMSSKESSGMPTLSSGAWEELAKDKSTPTGTRAECWEAWALSQQLGCADILLRVNHPKRDGCGPPDHILCSWTEGWVGISAQAQSLFCVRGQAWGHLVTCPSPQRHTASQEGACVSCALVDRSGYWPGVRGQALEPRTMVDPGQSLHPCLALEAVPVPPPPGEPEHPGTPRGPDSQRTPQGSPPAHRRSPTPFSGAVAAPWLSALLLLTEGFPSSRDAAGCFLRARLHGAEPRAIKGRAVEFLIGVNAWGPGGREAHVRAAPG